MPTPTAAMTPFQHQAMDDHITKDTRKSREVAEEIERLHALSVKFGKQLESEEEVIVRLTDCLG